MNNSKNKTYQTCKPRQKTAEYEAKLFNQIF